MWVESSDPRFKRGRPPPFLQIVYNAHLLRRWVVVFSQKNDCFAVCSLPWNIFIYIHCSILHIYSTISLDYSFFFYFFWKHMFRKWLFSSPPSNIYIHCSILHIYSTIFIGLLFFSTFSLDTHNRMEIAEERLKQTLAQKNKLIADRKMVSVKLLLFFNVLDSTIKTNYVLEWLFLLSVAVSTIKILIYRYLYVKSYIYIYKLSSWITLLFFCSSLFLFFF